MSQVAFSPDGNSTAWSDGSVLLLRTGAAAPPVHFPIGLASPDHMVMSLEFSPDSRRLASGGFDGTLALWDMSSRQLLWPAARAHRMAVAVIGVQSGRQDSGIGGDRHSGFRWQRAIVGHPIGPRIATGADRPLQPRPRSCLQSGWKDAGMRRGRADRPLGCRETAKLGEAVADNSEFVTSMAFSPDGRWLGSGGYSDGAIVWDLRPEVWLRQACAIANRNLDEREWKRLIGDNPPYRQSCP